MMLFIYVLLLFNFLFFFFFFNDTATTEIYTLSLHDALPISSRRCRSPRRCRSGRLPSWEIAARAAGQWMAGSPVPDPPRRGAPLQRDPLALPEAASGAVSRLRQCETAIPPNRGP